MFPATDRRRLLGMIAAITLLKAAAALALFRHPPTWEDGRMAMNLLEHGGLFLSHLGTVNYTLQFPTYALLIAGTYRLFGVHPPLMSLVNLAFSAVAAWILADIFDRLLRRLDAAGELEAWRPTLVTWAVLAFLLHPFLSYYAMNAVHPLLLDLLVFYLAVRLVLVDDDRGGPPDMIWRLGLATGLILLTRTTLLVALLPFVVLTARRRGWRRAATTTAIVLAIGFVISVPWLVRNYRLGRIIGYTSSTSEILWKGALAESEGSNYLADGERLYISVLSRAERARLATMSVREQSDFFFARYATLVRETPGQVARLFARKLRNFFWFRRAVGNEYGALMRRVMPLYMGGYAVVLATALLSIPLFGRGVLLPWTLIVGLGLFQAAFYVETRHRVVIEPLLILLALASVAALARRRADRAPRGIASAHGHGPGSADNDPDT